LKRLEDYQKLYDDIYLNQKHLAFAILDTSMFCKNEVVIK